MQKKLNKINSKSNERKCVWVFYICRIRKIQYLDGFLHTHTQCVIKLFFLLSFNWFVFWHPFNRRQPKRDIERREKKNPKKNCHLIRGDAGFSIYRYGFEHCQFIESNECKSNSNRKKNVPFHFIFQKLYFLFFSLCVKFLAHFFFSSFSHSTLSTIVYNFSPRRSSDKKDITTDWGGEKKINKQMKINNTDAIFCVTRGFQLYF